MTQLALDLGHRVALGRDDFLVAQNNAVAVSWIDRWPDWPGPALVLHGPVGCGKSHLAQVWQTTSGATNIGPQALREQSADALIGSAMALLIDGADECLSGDGAAEETLLHIFNMMAERSGSLLLTGQSAPARWPVKLPDLASRLSASQAVEVGPPDDALLGSILIKLFDDRQLRLKGEVVSYILARMERTFGAARDVVERIDKAALENRREITVPLARTVLQDVEESDGSQPGETAEENNGPGS